MWLPDSLYERLPIVQIGAGCACVGLLGHSPVANLSALLFFAAAALTTLWRRRARRPPASGTPTRRRPGTRR